jgi:hypothetical protein
MPAIYSMSFMQSNISFSQTSNSMLQISEKAKLLWLLTVIAPNWHSIPHSWSLLAAPTVCRYSFDIKLQLSVDTVLVIEICCVCALEGVTSPWVVPSTSPQYSSVRLKHRRNWNPLSIFRFSFRALLLLLGCLLVWGSEAVRSSGSSVNGGQFRNSWYRGHSRGAKEDSIMQMGQARIQIYVRFTGTGLRSFPNSRKGEGA